MSHLPKFASHHPAAVEARLSRLNFEREYGGHETETVDYGLQRTRALVGIAELCRLAERRLKEGKPLNWHKLAYCWAVCALMFPGGGRYRLKHGKYWREYQREYFATWPHATAEAMLKHIAGAPRKPSIIEAVQSGIDKARRRRAKGFVNADTAAKMLDVNRAERDLLQLHTIGATDFLKAERQAEAKAKRRERNRARQATARAAAGARPRSESYAALKPWEAFGESRASFYRRPKEEREQMRKHVIGDRETDSSPYIFPTGIKRPGHGTVPEKLAETPRVTPFPSTQPQKPATSDFRRNQRFDGGPLAEAPPAAPIASEKPAGDGGPLAEVATEKPAGNGARLRWWEQPVEDPPGKITLYNIVRDETVTIRLRGRPWPERCATQGNRS